VHALTITMSAKGHWLKHVLNVILRRQPFSQSRNKGRQISLRVGNRNLLIDERREAPYISNAIRTSRYTIWDFLHCQLLFQFSRLAHAYLMVVAILQVIPGLSTTSKFTTIIPLTIFVFLVIAKEGYYDWKRYRADVAENSQTVFVLRNATSGPRSEGEYPGSSQFGSLQWVPTSWEDIGVGDVIKLARNEDVPADIVVLHASGDSGHVYVDTMALDGETNLKPKQPPANILNCSTIQGVADCRADFNIENPNADLYRFDSTVTANDRTLPMKTDEVIYRGCTIRNTTAVVGMVVNTGEECKIRMNAKQTTRSKRPALEGVTNNIVIFLMLYVVSISTALTIGYSYWRSSEEAKAWYLSNGTVPIQEIFFGFIIMFNQVIPLSLYIGLETIKLCQASLIDSDLAMYHEESDTPAQVNNTNSLDDLGQISYVFTDKTGTLTENTMNLRRVSVAGISWLQQMDLKNAEASGLKTHGAGLTTEDMLQHIRSKPNSPFAIHVTRFLLAMALCHTCIPETEHDDNNKYKRSSPDEVALAMAVKDMGFVVTHRSSHSATILAPDENGNARSQVFQILDVIEFSSDRKRMTVIVQRQDGNLWLICKGADNILLPRLVNTPSDSDNQQTGSIATVRMVDRARSRHQDSGVASTYRSRSSTASSHNISEFGVLGLDQVDDTDEYDAEAGIPLRSNPLHSDAHSIKPPSALINSSETLSAEDSIRRCYQHVEDYAEEGLRTLIYADKVLSAEEYGKWKRLFSEAEASLTQRLKRIEEVGEMIEKSLHLIGASAVEDKLQNGVPEAIEKLRRANVNICMLTGDKRETAIHIAHSTRICSSDSSIQVLDVVGGDLELQLTNATNNIEEFRRARQHQEKTSAAHTAVVVDGGTLNAIEQPSTASLRRLFYRLVPTVDSIICCRASPFQKSLLINIVQDGTLSNTNRSLVSAFVAWFKRPRKPLTLAIGDGP
jgi:phospholipid-translocating ATPase